MNQLCLALLIVLLPLSLGSIGCAVPSTITIRPAGPLLGEGPGAPSTTNTTATATTPTGNATATTAIPTANTTSSVSTVSSGLPGAAGGSDDRLNVGFCWFEVSPSSAAACANLEFQWKRPMDRVRVDVLFNSKRSELVRIGEMGNGETKVKSTVQADRTDPRYDTRLLLDIEIVSKDPTILSGTFCQLFVKVDGKLERISFQPVPPVDVPRSAFNVMAEGGLVPIADANRSTRRVGEWMEGFIPPTRRN